MIIIINWLDFNNSNNFLWVSIELTNFNYISIRNISLGISALKSHYTAVYRENHK